MARATPDRLADALSSLLRDFDVAVRERFRDVPRHAARWRVQRPRHRKPGKIAGTLRRLIGLG